MSERADSSSTSPPAFDAEMAEILESFIVETKEILERLGQDLLTLEKGNPGAELLNSVFRAVHTIKGTSSFLGLEQITELAHRFEDVLNKFRKGELTVTPERMDVLFDAYDITKTLLERIEQRNSAPVDLSRIIPTLVAIAGPQKQKIAATPSEHPLPVAGAPVQDSDPAEARSSGIPATTTSGTAVQSSGAEDQPETHPAAKSVDTTIRVDVARLDSLMNLVGELVLGRNRLTQISSSLSELYEDVPAARELADTSAQIDFITTELQMAVMKARMVPIARVFNKLPRLIRDLMKETGKEIDLVLAGEETELDKTIIEQLNDPLIHILRNAADHGIEAPEERRAAGKPTGGTVRVTAEHEGNHVVISIADDGKGMDPERLKAKAIEKGMITESQAAEMSRTDAFNLIFAPGFSTAMKVTNVSGRGVGMDVVRTNITRLKGIIEIQSTAGSGSTFIIKLPLTLAIIQALLVEVAKEVFSLPLGSVLEVIRVQAREISTINGREVVRLRDSVLPIARMNRVLALPSNGHGKQWMYIVVVGLAEQRLGIIVDALIGQKEVVIKSLGSYLGAVPGIAGSTILGDGRVIMIIDVGELMHLCATQGS